MSSTDFMYSLIEATGVMFTPGQRIRHGKIYPDGFANPLDVLSRGADQGFRIP